MLDPFRGEMTAKYVHEDDLRWAARERLVRRSVQSRDVEMPARRETRRFPLGFLPARARGRAALKA